MEIVKKKCDKCEHGYAKTNGNVGCGNEYADFDPQIYCEYFETKSIECKHTITQNDKCVDCGDIVYANEMHQCCECLHFKKGISEIPICKKKMMIVLEDMHVHYKIEEGTCFELK